MQKYAEITDQVCELAPSEKVVGHRTSDVVEASTGLVAPWSSGDGAGSLDNCTKSLSSVATPEASPPLTSQQVMAINLMKARMEHAAKPPPKRGFFHATFTHIYRTSGSDGAALTPSLTSPRSWAKPHK
jgi:hypothetical protein